MFKAVLLGQWYSLSDPNLEESLALRLDFIMFTNFDGNYPDETTLCRFRNKLTKYKLWDKLLKEVNEQLSEKGLFVKDCEGAIVNATVIESSSRPRKSIEVKKIDKDREEKEASQEARNIIYSKDPDARWLKKAHKYHFGYKGFLSVNEEGFIQKAHITSANVSEMHQLTKTIDSLPCKAVYADKGFACKKNREFLKQKKIKDRIMHKAVRNRPLTKEEKKENRSISKVRYIVEQTFGTLKRRFHFWRSSYIGSDKTLAQLTAKSLCLNLLKAVRGLSF